MAKAKKKLTRKPQAAAPAPVVVPPVVVTPKAVTVQINAKYLRAMRHVAAQRDIRYYLNGVYFRATKDGGKVYVATDGHRIGVIQEAWGNGEEPQDIELLIPRAVAAAAKPLSKTLSHAVLTQVDTWTWTLQGGGDIAQTFKAIDGKFPDWTKVIPTACSGENGSYNWRYLHDFDLLAKDAFGHKFSCELQQNGTSAGIVTCGSNSFVGMIMPVRMSSPSMPQWAIKLQQDKATEAANAEATAKVAA